jgi:hypothetical protein
MTKNTASAWLPFDRFYALAYRSLGERISWGKDENNKLDEGERRIGLNKVGLLALVH